MAEMRLINANDIPWWLGCNDDGRTIVYTRATDVDAMPTIDAVPVVRCQYCKHFRRNEMDDTYCDRGGGLTDPEEHEFCSYGQRRDDGLH